MAADDQQAVPIKEVIRLLIQSSPANCDEPLIREVLGERAAKSLSEIAQAFGVAAATVRHTWRRDGMPGDARGKRFVYADVLIWYLKRNNANAAARGVDEFTQRKRAAETRKAEFDALITEQRAQRATGGYIAVATAISGVRGLAATLRDQVADIPRRMEIRFPPKHAKESVADLETMLRNALQAFTERSISEIRAAAEKWSDGDV